MATLDIFVKYQEWFFVDRKDPESRQNTCESIKALNKDIQLLIFRKGQHMFYLLRLP
jgi:hypothetical protein